MTFKSPLVLALMQSKKISVRKLSSQYRSAQSLVILLATLLSALCYGQEESQEESFEFALLGDNPYSVTTRPLYERLIEHVNQQHLPWVIHLGDVKGGSVSCSDEQFRNYYQLNQQFDSAFIVTPGDNDWLDCKGEDAGGFSEYERLNAFRKIFYPNAGMSTGAKPMAVYQQSQQAEFAEFVENVRWERAGVLFATVHVVALTEPATDTKQRDKRVAAAKQWIEELFSIAKQTQAKGVFLSMQADPWITWGMPALLRRSCPRCANPRTSLEWLYPLLRQTAVDFGKPVVLAVGDTHVFRVDKPLYRDSGELVENFTRVETFGNPDVHWVQVRVEPDSSWVFSFQQQIVP